MLILEGAQAGLSWRTILHRREGYRAAFAGFDPERVAGFGGADVDRLMQDPGIIRARAKIEAAIGNARAFLAMEASGESLSDLAGAWSAARRSGAMARPSRPALRSPLTCRRR